MYSRGKGTPIDFDEARRWFEKAADVGHVEGLFRLGRLALRRERYQEAKAWFEEAAAQNCPPAIYFLGHLYEAGLGVAKDQAKATKLFEEGAKQGHLYAQGRLARALLRGAEGVWTIPKGLLLALLTIKTVLTVYLTDPQSPRLRV